MTPDASVRQLRTPRYLLRTNLAKSLVRRLPRGRVLEIGPGTGDFLVWLGSKGFEAVGLEISPDVFPLAERATSGLPNISLVGEESQIGEQRFRYVMAYEVLEHIPDDREILLRWRRWLAPGGRMILSVPAHMSRWSPTDELVGHHRRYERVSLAALLEECGLQVETMWTYGFPVTSLTRRLRSLVSRGRPPAEETRHGRTLRSAIESTWGEGTPRWLAAAFNQGLGSCLHGLQLPFRGTDLGDGYLVACRRT